MSGSEAVEIAGIPPLPFLLNLAIIYCPPTLRGSASEIATG